VGFLYIIERPRPPLAKRTAALKREYKESASETGSVCVMTHSSVAV